jgi:FkbM family methyltransferase
MYLDSRDVALTPHLLTDGYWEMHNTEAMAKLIKPGMTAVDLGANLGYFSLLMSDLVGPEGKVHAIEANPHIAAVLRDSVEINGFAGRTMVHSLAISDFNGSTDFYLFPERPMNATLTPMQGAERLEVPIKRFDDMPELETADFVKIDVEGAEEAVWTGMTKRLENLRPLTVILEFTSGRYADAGAFVDRFSECGLSLNRIDDKRGITRTTKTEVLSYPSEKDQLLVLQR